MKHLPKLNCRWFRFSLRSLLVLVLFVSIGVSWLSVKMYRVRKQRAAVTALAQAGCYVAYEDLYYEHYSPPSAWIAKWALSVFGEDFFFDVVAADAYQNDFGDDGTEHLKELADIGVLELTGTKVTDAGLEHVGRLTNLQELLVEGSTQVTDVGLEHLKGLSNLEYLALTGTRVTGSGLEHLNGLTHFNKLSLNNTRVTDAGLEAIGGLTNLEFLDLRDTQITDAGLTHLKGLTMLNALHLNDTRVTNDAELKKALPNLTIFR